MFADDPLPFQEKAVYKPPAGVSPNLWRDCWVIRAPSADGCSGRYVVAASAGNAMDSGFCSWDFYTKDVRAFHFESEMPPSRTVLGPLPSNISYTRNTFMDPEARQWWYKPCGPLIVTTSSCQRVVRLYDIRDGEQIMKWDVAKPVSTMDYSSPLQWRNRGKVVVAEAETLSLWDVNSLSAQALLSVPLSGRKITALHVNNSDAELGGGVRQRYIYLFLFSVFALLPVVFHTLLFLLFCSWCALVSLLIMGSNLVKFISYIYIYKCLRIVLSTIIFSADRCDLCSY